MIRLLIADDKKLIRQGYCALLLKAPDIEIVGEAINGLEAVRLAQELSPDVVILDVTMPKLSGLDAAAQIHSTRPEMPMLIISSLAEDSIILEAIRNGARGYVLKFELGTELVTAIRIIAGGGWYFSQSIFTRVSQIVISHLVPGTERIAASRARPVNC